MLIEQVDISLLQKFIDLCEDCIETHNDYNKLCLEVSGKYNLKRLDVIQEDLSLECTRKVNSLSSVKNINDKQVLYKMIEQMEIDNRKLLKYNKINQLYKEFETLNMKDFFQISDSRIESKISKKYPKYSGVVRESQKVIEYSKLEQKRESSFEQIYIDMKTLYDMIMMSKNGKKKGFLGNLFKRKNNNEELENKVEIYFCEKLIIEKFNEIYENRILEARKIANQSDECEIISDDICIINVSNEKNESNVNDNVVYSSRSEQIRNLLELKENLINSQVEDRKQKTA